ncbi:TetR/AcrR family transcriptional regulator [Amycolatopsis acidicola]|uniref:TetR/AcrR family transcriptional regulator n=1 Tax=Amycolatopsis acidicola TaxID=2596893 RepID=A0A5N0UMG5_9PSEU|nr:TetR family transcriptional regulator [Amycolatopsis acidicola]KAA9151064.1 TetR/AcrR family transcriptional regulator [Amycolatopsis acidicola]
MAAKTARAVRVTATREAILTAAERLFAEHGVYAVSNRQISEAAGQGNTAAVGYHFGSKADLVRAITRRHTARIEELRAGMVTRAAGSTDLREWLECLVRPSFEHLAGLAAPTWFARFAAQVMTDPALRDVMAEESLDAPSLQRILAGIDRCRPELPPEVRAERDDMTRQLMTHVIAERERALAEGTPTARPSWQEAATGLIDALSGLWQAPATRD